MKELSSGVDFGKINKLRVIVIHNFEGELPLAVGVGEGTGIDASELICNYSPCKVRDTSEVDGVAHIFPVGNC